MPKTKSTPIKPKSAPDALAAAKEELSQDAGMAPDARGEVARGDSGHPGRHPEEDEARRAVESLDVGPQHEEAVHINEQVQPADVDEDRRDEPPPLALIDQRIVLRAEEQQRATRHHLALRVCAPEVHEQKDEDVEGEEDERERRGAREDSAREAKRFGIVVRA
jgi:hypothetical protein